MTEQNSPIVTRFCRCDGSSACAAEQHVHGCYADRGNCDRPDHHGKIAGIPVVVDDPSRPWLVRFQYR